MNDYICGPQFFFHQFLDNLQDLLEDVPLDLRQESWNQLDGAAGHYNYPWRCIGRLRNANNQEWIITGPVS